MADIQNNTSKRAALEAKLKSKYPEQEYADDEALFGQINDDYDRYDKEIGDYKAGNDKLRALFDRDPRNAQFLADMSRGEDPWLGIVRRLGRDGVMALIDDPAKQDEFAKANQEFVERVAEDKRLQEEYDSNLQSSLQMIEQLKEKRGLTDEQIDAAFDLVNKMAHEAITGVYTEETIGMALKALNYDAEVENAQAQGEVRGRNAKIEEKLRKPKPGEGLPQLSGTNNGAGRGVKSSSMFELAAGA